MTTLPAELRNRVVADGGFDPGNAVVLVADGTNADIELQLFAPGMSVATLTTLHETLVNRLNVALAGLDDEMFIEVISNGQLGAMTVVINDPGHTHSAPKVDIVLRIARGIVEATEHAHHRRVFTLRDWECLVIVDWDEPFSTYAHTFTLKVPAEADLASNANRERFTELAHALLDRTLGVNIHTHKDGQVEYTLQSINGRRIPPVVAREQLRRLMFIISTLVRLRGVNSVPVMELSRRFDPYVDDGSDVPERYDEY